MSVVSYERKWIYLDLTIHPERLKHGLDEHRTSAHSDLCAQPDDQLSHCDTVHCQVAGDLVDKVLNVPRYSW